MSVKLLQAQLDAAGVVYFRGTELLRIRYPEIARRAGITTRYFDADAKVRAELVRVAKVADLMRERFGAPLVVLNGYRPKAYNRLVNGAASSQHIYGRAIDLTCPRSEMPRLRDLAHEMWAAGEIGGLGCYIGNIHIDTARHRGWGSQLRRRP